LNTVPGTFANLSCDISQPASKIGQTMRIVFMAGGFSTTNVLFLNKFLQYGLDAHFVYTRMSPADFEVLKSINTTWIDLSRFKYLPKLLRWLIFGYETISIIKKIKPDVILTQGIQVHGLFSVLSGIRPILLMPWGSDWAIVAHKNSAMRLLSRYVVNHVDLVQIDCEVGKRTILELSQGKVKPQDISVFPQGIELDVFKPKAEIRKSLRDQLEWNDKKVLIMTRQLKPIYGIDVFLKAVAQIIKEVPDVRALIVGDGPLELELKTLACSLGLSESVRFIGRVDREELVNYLNAGDIYVSTSYSDGTSLCLLEAMAVGLSAVVTDVPANLEWIENGYNGFVARRGFTDDVAEALQKLVNNSSLCRTFGDRNLTIAKERADWDKNFDKMLRMFEHVLQRDNRFAAPWFPHKNPGCGPSS
jgi:glycosyltransferase involved in cell wall biosynthesis